MTSTPLTHLLRLRTTTLRSLGDTAWVAARGSPTLVVAVITFAVHERAAQPH
ncbi:MAG: hypothetical protein WCF36_08805 [Candidatus Nanopelagicales bacterium]